MKTIYLLLILFVAISAKAQELKFNALGADTIAGPFTSYLSKDGVLFKVGDNLKIGQPSAVKEFKYITRKELEMTADETILVLLKKQSMREPSDTPIGFDAANSDSKINSISLSGTKKTGFYALIKSEGKNMQGIIEPSTYTVKVENAIEAGEIKTSLLSSDQALADLKRAKDKLDLALITKEKYDSIKTELTKYIK